ncbi:MAG TPA: PAS domain-containing sensor histidine kinase, partial [Magnetospirillum sp.]|nr:PAS domain-containing sensor histidine kinase [Magnetospirillum sp.]
LPVASDQRIRLTLECMTVLLALGGVAAITWRRLGSGLMWAYRVALLTFAISSATFLMTEAWTHLWWLAHGIFACGFFFLSHGVARALLTTRSLQNIYSPEEMIARVAAAEATAAASRAAEERLTLLFDASPIGVMVTTPDGRVLFCNRPLATLLGQEPEQLVGQDVAAFYGDPEIRRRAVNEALATGRAVTREIECPKPDGRSRWALLTWTPVTFANRPAVVAWGLDVTERHETAQAQAEARQAAELANRCKTEFLAAMSHELRTPLNAISGFAETMQAEMLGPLGNDRYREYCGHIVEAGQHLSGLINDVLDVSRVESGSMALRDEVVEVAALMHSAQVMVSDRAREIGLAIEIALAPGLPALSGDPLRLKQVLLNLLANAVKFTPAGGRIVMRGRLRDDGGVTLTVEDTGIGISPEDRERVMQAFGQVDSRLARRYQGMGLGLSLAASLMKLHGGRLDIDGAPGRGTRVTLDFPPQRTLAGGQDDTPIPQPDTASG